MGFEQLAALKDILAEEAKQQAKQQAKQHRSEQKNVSDHPELRSLDARAKHAPGTTRPLRTQRSSSEAVRRHQARRDELKSIVHIIGTLQERFPDAFPKHPAPKIPLRSDILRDVLGQANHLGLKKSDLLVALATWRRGSRYWASQTEGAPKHNLKGYVVGYVTAQEARRAETLLNRRGNTSVGSWVDILLPLVLRWRPFVICRRGEHSR